MEEKVYLGLQFRKRSPYGGGDGRQQNKKMRDHIFNSNSKAERTKEK